MNAATMEQGMETQAVELRVMETAQEKTSAPGAKASLVYGILGFWVAGLIFGCLAISKALSAKDLIGKSPDRYTGGGLATAGLILGVIDILGMIATLMMFMAG